MLWNISNVSPILLSNVVVDLYGQCADYDPLVRECAEYDVPLIEDAAPVRSRAMPA